MRRLRDSEEAMKAMMARDFPPVIFDPWRELVAEAQEAKVEPLHADWQAGTRPLLGVVGPVTYTLRRFGDPDSTKGTRYSVEYSGPDPRDVLRCAARFDLQGAR